MPQPQSVLQVHFSSREAHAQFWPHVHDSLLISFVIGTSWG
jgi:hypothetical protein